MSESKSYVVLVTGCSSGLGLSLAVLLAKAGHKVYGTMRDVSKATELNTAAAAAGTNVNVVALDVTNQESTDACVATVLEKEGRIDVLVNNAGAALFRATEQATMAEAQQCFDTNFFGSLRVTKAVIPHMRKAKSGRILNVSSVGGLVGQPMNDLYCAAKFAVDGWSESLATTLVEFGIHVSVINPGGILTPFAQNAMKIIGGNVPNDEYKTFVERYLGGFAARNRAKGTAQTAEQVALVIKSAIDAEKPHFRYLTSEWTKEFTYWKTHDDVDGDKLIKATRDTCCAPLDAAPSS